MILYRGVLKQVELQNKRILNGIVKRELDKIFKTDYYGTLEQIDNEMLIMENVFVKDNCEMKYNESIEEWYLRIYDLTKEE
jgi:regulator of PEP synthase PpsR (kinase-PPPase family)